MRITKTKVGIAIAVVVLYIIVKPYAVHKYRQVTPEESDRWQRALKPVYFKGRVVDIKPSDNKSRVTRTIYLEIIDEANLNLPDSCEYLKRREGRLLLTASNINISYGPDHEIKRDNILTKLANSDTVIVANSSGCVKYYFPLFDGLGKEKHKMDMSATSLCDW
jgi:hypothetical protein